MKIESRRNPWLQPTFVSLFAASFVLGGASALVVPFGSLWARTELGMAAWVFGLFVVTNALGAIIARTALARWSDSHLSRRTVLSIGASAGVLGNLANAQLRNPVSLILVGFSVFGVASVTFSQLFAHAREELERPEFAETDARFALGVLRAGTSLAWVLGPMAGAAVLGRWGYPALFRTSAALQLAFLWLVRATVAQRLPLPRTAQVGSGQRQPRWSGLTWSGLSEPQVRAPFLAFTLVSSAFTLNAINLPLLITQRLGGSEHQVGVVFGLTPIFEMPFMLWFGRLAAKGLQAGLIRIGLALAMGYFLVLTRASGVAGVYPLQVLLAASTAVAASVAIPFFQDLLPGQNGVATSLLANAASLGILIGSVLFGLTADRLGPAELVLLCALLSALSASVVWWPRARTRLEPGSHSTC